MEKSKKQNNKQGKNKTQKTKSTTNKKSTYQNLKKEIDFASTSSLMAMRKSHDLEQKIDDNASYQKDTNIFLIVWMIIIQIWIIYLTLKN